MRVRARIGNTREKNPRYRCWEFCFVETEKNPAARIPQKSERKNERHVYTTLAMDP